MDCFISTRLSSDTFYASAVGMTGFNAGWLPRQR